MEASLETGDQELQELLEKGESNPRLENFLSNYKGSFSDGVPVPPLQDRECNLCGIPEDPEENILASEDEYFVVEAATKKGHESRNLIVMRDDRWIPSDSELEEYAGMGLHDLVETTFENYSGNGPVVVYAGMNTFTHPHLVANELEVQDEEHSKLDEINNYIVFEDGESFEDPIQENYGDTVGEAVLQRFYEAALRD
jgi:hypothetical protein